MVRLLLKQGKQGDDMLEPSSSINRRNPSPAMQTSDLASQASSYMVMGREELAIVVETAARQLAQQARPPEPPFQEVEAQTELTLRFPDGTYVGEVQNGEPHGRGTMDYFPGLKRRRYEGQWKDGEFHGKGLLIRSNGDQYEGDWQNGRFYGKGIFKAGDGSRIYTGEWQFGVQHGKGEMHIESDGKYDGAAVVSCRCIGEEGSSQKGKGQFITTYKGDYVCGFPHGEGEENYTIRGEKQHNYNYRGGFKSGYHHGEGFKYFDDGDFDHGTFAYHVLVKGSRLSKRYPAGSLERSEGIFRDGSLWEGEIYRKRAGSYENNNKCEEYKTLVVDGVKQEEKRINKPSCCTLL